MHRLTERQRVFVSANTGTRMADLEAVVVAVDDNETILHVPDDPRGLFVLEPYNPVACLTFADGDQTISLRGYLRQSEWSTLRFGVTDGVQLRPRRRRARLDVALGVCLVDGEEGSTVPDEARGVTRDISVGGFSAVFEQPPPAGRRLLATIRIGSRSLQADCECTRSSGSRCSFRWTTMSLEDRAMLGSYVLREKALEAKWS
jgi:PilZ domain-containing protein